ncbi:flagellar basal body-associated FliL family protein [Indioceanicola profundi]|uniref:flagellar basal body-associated FliL family protein n=1 Tax=Indioceanicola profundi TaxID=2220096 RepID=UPI000E6AB3AF|nr:flagellar basal body-associated FliL family protein [Indioceanicola profundi]
MTAIETDGGGITDQDIPRKKLSGKKIVLFIVLPLLIVIGGGAAVFFSGLLGGHAGEHGEEHAEQPAAPAYTGPPVFLPMEEILVNLNTQERRPVFLKLNITLELMRPEDQAAIQGVMPRIVDTFQVYLRELRPDDLRGSAGLYRLREELQMRVNAAAHPVRIKDVLINEFLVQ